LTGWANLWQNLASLVPDGIEQMSASSILQSIDKSQRRQQALPEFRPGDSIKVWAKIREGEKTRLQAFEGVCIRRASKGARSTFTVRKISYGVGVERVFPDNSPNIDKVEIVQRGRVHQAKLYYLRDLSGKAARIKERENTHEAAPAVETVAELGADGLPVKKPTRKERNKAKSKTSA
jgi:large subunit ribosomal protein L19